ncbi:hypothetical protein QJS04_geneDACA000588 [Acorus gramineus]|uniref:Defective in cullin neddylation protein n=1 Tax=Acorus gramineus TaxID=55184 RepID=A0AAV9ATS9_ACOGR|nr:hypothetical protein QJS04_geneDACA000588 [Acorus gramineus]
MEIFDIYLRYCSVASVTFGLVDEDNVFSLILCQGAHLEPPSRNCLCSLKLWVRERSKAVSSAVDAWKLVLNGRFRFLNEWCEFVQNHCRHSISEDTWDQFLVFSCCVHEDLEGHDPNGAWPILIDDFVEHIYRKTQLTDCTSQEICCSCGETPTEPSISNTLQGLKLFAGSKRRLELDADAHEDKASVPKSGSSTPPMHGKGSVPVLYKKIQRISQGITIV